MSTVARDLLNAFDALDPAEKREVAVEILRRSMGAGELPDQAFDDMAAELFVGYDAEETAGADR
jgi:hypothetical protein